MPPATASEQSKEIFAKLSDEAWQQLGSRPLSELSLANVAKLAEVNVVLARAVAGDLHELVLGKIAELDDKAILETFDDIEDAGEISIREKILEALMHRFEVYAPYRKQINSLTKAALVQPDLGIALSSRLKNTTRRILAMAGDSCDGWRGLIRLKGVMGVVILVARVWMKDKSQDLAPTMKALDQRLQQAEEWGVSLKLFSQKKEQ